MYKQGTLVMCINSEGWNHPEFELAEGQLYTVHEVKSTPSLFGIKSNMKLVFLCEDGEKKIEINARRFKIMQKS